MKVLPSGRIIDLSTHRSKYHALRQPGASPDSGHRQLYALVDVIYRRVDDAGIPRRGWTDYDYDYSGYTLDTVRFASDWSDADKIALSQWIQQDEQQRRIEYTRRRLVDNQRLLSNKLYTAPQYLYSLLRHRLTDLPMQRASVKQWLGTINNMKQYGIRDEEIQWSGLHRYLLQHSAETVVSKIQLLEKLDYGNIRLELSTEQVWDAHGELNFNEVAKRMLHQPVYRAALKLDDTCLCVLRYVDRIYNYRVGVVKTLSNDHKMALNKYWFALDPYGRAIPNLRSTNTGESTLFFNSAVAAKYAANEYAQNHLKKPCGASDHTHYDHLTLFGGRDYREWIVSLPDYQRIFFGAHFYDHNVLAHIRTTTRIDRRGRKILFVEEVQSDWHQSAIRYGYDNTYWGRVANAPFKQEWPVLAVKLMLIYASQNDFCGIAWSAGNIQEMRYMRHLNSVKKYYDKEIPKALNRLVKEFGCKVEFTHINTRDPWLNLEKTQDKWRVADVQGKFKTRAKYNNRDEAMAVIARHCRAIDLRVPALILCDNLRRKILEKGLPLFGYTIS